MLVKADVEIVRRPGTNIAAADSSRFNLDQHIVVTGWRDGHIANLYGQRPQENTRPIRRRNIYSHRFWEVYSGGRFEGVFQLGTAN